MFSICHRSEAHWAQEGRCPIADQQSSARSMPSAHYQLSASAFSYADTLDDRHWRYSTHTSLSHAPSSCSLFSVCVCVCYQRGAAGCQRHITNSRNHPGVQRISHGPHPQWEQTGRADSRAQPFAPTETCSRGTSRRCPGTAWRPARAAHPAQTLPLTPRRSRPPHPPGR
jgi:hypothetical protein